ncbi:MAG: hypothetical protein KBT87_04260 [Gammaproteobacteria bacterium]|jgi:hypothetical protein|nr:hypothetical protein [Gammaproteobacteria bacterium]MBQ0773867.1 hypothetical protein [Gammaproteobacteria bacterium]|tara:strand:+ start:31493 stop:32176 length:684 start_codon:yes stop_codon:yes gene_type:complete
MTQFITYVAFASSDKLHQTTDGFIQRMRGPNPQPEPQTIEKIMHAFLDESLHAFMVRPAQLSNLSPNLMRIVRFTTETISRASHVVVKSTVKKLNTEQTKEMAEYMDTVRAEFDGTWYICFPISEQLSHTGQQGFHMAIDGKREQALPMMIEYFHNITDIAMKCYFEEPIKLLRLGPILGKIAGAGIATSRKATHAVVDKVIPKLDADQAKVSAEYALSLLKTAPSS